MAKKPSEKLHIKGKVVEVVTCGLVIISHAEDNQAKIEIQQPLWNPAYFTGLSTRLTGYLGSYSGEDRCALQRDQTKLVKSLNVQAKERLSSFKIQLSANFRTNKPRLAEILNTLGYTTYWKKANTGSESFLVDLLERYNTNMTTDLQTEIIAAGGNVINIAAIKTLAATLPAANVVQEKLKSDKMEVTEFMVHDFNDAYDELMSICKVGANIFLEDPIIHLQFSYAHTLRVLRNSAAKKVTPPEPVPPVTLPINPPTV